MKHTKADWTMNARKVILDCDPGIDDALALMLALSLPGLVLSGSQLSAGMFPSKGRKKRFENP